MNRQRLLIISRNDIFDICAQSKGEALFRTLAKLTRGRYNLLATAPQGQEWTRKNGGADDTLLGPDSIRRKLSDAGGTLDGVYYVPRSLITQKRNRIQALTDIHERYGIKPKRCFLFSSSRKFIEAAQDLGFRTISIRKDTDLIKELNQLQ